PGRSRFDRIADAVERSYSKGGFILAFCRGDLGIARGMGVPMVAADFLRIAVTAPFVLGRLGAVTGAYRISWLRPALDRYLTGLVGRRLAVYGNPEFVSDASTYTPVAG
ncbi:oxygenase MpaB family protein, partial [Nocardia sp. NPDC003345]